MVSHKLTDLGKLIVKNAPAGMSNKAIVIALQSFPKGVVPEHLKGYTSNFTAAAKECASTVRGMPAGAQKIQAMRACVGAKLRR